MKYVIDTCAIRELLFHFDPSVEVFNNMWNRFEEMLVSKEASFVKESYEELQRQISSNVDQYKWLENHKQYFEPANNDECQIISDLYSKVNFQNNIPKKSIMEGRPVADPFVVAKAKLNNAKVVSMEKVTSNAAKIPNMCEYLGVNYMNIVDFQKILFKN